MSSSERLCSLVSAKRRDEIDYIIKQLGLKSDQLRSAKEMPIPKIIQRIVPHVLLIDFEKRESPAILAKLIRRDESLGGHSVIGTHLRLSDTSRTIMRLIQAGHYVLEPKLQEHYCSGVSETNLPLVKEAEAYYFGLGAIMPRKAFLQEVEALTTMHGGNDQRVDDAIAAKVGLNPNAVRAMRSLAHDSPSVDSVSLPGDTHATFAAHETFEQGVHGKVRGLPVVRRQFDARLDGSVL